MARSGHDRDPGRACRGLRPRGIGASNCIPNATHHPKPALLCLYGLDLWAFPMHFWDPMMNRVACTGFCALESALVSRAGGMMFTTIITMTTRTRGASG